MSSWISHWAIMENAIFPGDMYANCIKFDKLDLKDDQYIDVPEDHNWLLVLLPGGQVEGTEQIRGEGTMIVWEIGNTTV